MKTKFLALTFILSIVLLSCRKDREVADYQGNYTLSGRVLDEITGQGIPYATIGVIERKREWFSAIAGKTVAYDKADADGNYSFTFPVNSKENNYYLTARALTYFERTDGGDAIRFTKNGSKEQNIELMPHGYLARVIKGNKGGNKLSINWNAGGGVYYRGIDTISVAFKVPGVPIYSVYTIRDVGNNIVSQVFDTLFTYPHDTTYYLIEF